jgi:hypothetical protein
MKTLDTRFNRNIPNPYGPWGYVTASPRQLRRQKKALERKAAKRAKLAKRRSLAKAWLAKSK